MPAISCLLLWLTAEHVLCVLCVLWDITFVVCSSLDMGLDGATLQAEAPVREREVCASKATLYTNVYSGPSASLEYSEFSEHLSDVKNVAEVASKDILELRGDIDKIKLKLKDSQLDKQTAPAAPKTLGSGFGDDQVSSAQEERLKQIQCVALPCWESAVQRTLSLCLHQFTAVSCIVSGHCAAVRSHQHTVMWGWQQDVRGVPT